MPATTRHRVREPVGLSQHRTANLSCSSFTKDGRDAKGAPHSLKLMLRYICTGDVELAHGNKTLRIAIRDIRRTVQDLQSEGACAEIIKKAVAADKNSLPSVCFSGLFIVRDARGLQLHTQCVCVDLDHLTPERIRQLKQQFETDPHVLVMFLSPTATGLKVVFRVSGLEQWTGIHEMSQTEYANLANKFHLAAYGVLEAYVLNLYQERIDSSCKDVNRLCYLSYDPDLLYNENAVPLPVPPPADGSESESGPSPKPGTKGPSPKPSASCGSATEEKATEGEQKSGRGRGASHEGAHERDESQRNGTRQAKHADVSADRLREWLKFVQADDRAIWLRVLGALKNWGQREGQDEAAFQLADEWSRTSTKYNAEDQQRTWESLNRGVGENTATVGTIVFLARKNGWSGALKPSEWMKTKFAGLAECHGEPFDEIWVSTDKDNDETQMVVASACESFLAATLGEMGAAQSPAVFSATHKAFFQYQLTEGIYAQTPASVLGARISSLLLECARACKHQIVNTRSLEFRLRATRATSPVIERAKGLLAVDDTFWDIPDLVIPCKNGVIDLRVGDFVPFTPRFHFRSKLGVTFQAESGCPKWQKLLAGSLAPDDIELLQRWFGLLLFGRNIAQKMLMLIGNAQAGKGVIARIATALAGAEAVGTLRTSQLDGRFELGRLRYKRLIYGPDVSPTFLLEQGAHLLKAITGEDPQDAELKGSNQTPPAQPLRGLVLITANSRLKIRLEDDSTAWRRRLVVLKFERESISDAQQISGLSDILIVEEGAGILNWAIEGLAALDEAGFKLLLNERQQGVRDDLLSESESYKIWAHERVVRDQGDGAPSRLMVEDAFSDYIGFCDERDWVPLTRKSFTRRVSDVIAREFHVTMRRDLRTENGTYGRGWSGITVKGGDFGLPPE